MNICINIYGQQRNLNNTKQTIDQLIDNKNNFTVLYTGWCEETNDFENFFKNAYVRRINKNTEIIKNYLQRYSFIKIDSTNSHKNLEHILTGFYIKNESINTIEEYLYLNKNKKFDLIITIRTDTKIHDNKIVNFDIVKDNEKVYVANEIDWNIYNECACNDTFVISNYTNMKKILNQIDYLQEVVLSDNKTFHPETSFYKYLKFNNFNIERLDLKVHPN